MVQVVLGFELSGGHEAHGGGGRRLAHSHRRHETFFVAGHFAAAEIGLELHRRKHLAAAAADSAAAGRTVHGGVQHHRVAGRSSTFVTAKPIKV